MNISLIVAMARNRVIGKDNDLVWNLPDDMKYFMETTRGHHVVMGRKNWNSIPPKYRPLSNRTNIVLTRNSAFQLEEKDTFVFTDFDQCLSFARDRGEEDLFIIGGAQIYEMAMPVVDTMYITEVDGEPEGDTFFPRFELQNWTEVSRRHHPLDNRHKFAFDFVVYQKKS